MTLNEIAYNLLNQVRGGRSHNDEHISLDQIKFNIKHYRAVFIRRDYSRSGFNSRHTEQDLGCLELIKVDPSKCCNLPSSCSVYRTTEKIPRTVRYSFEEALTHIGDITGTGTIPLVNSNMIQFLPWDKYTNVRGVFEDPAEVAKFKNCSGSDCYDDNVHNYPIPMDMLEQINKSILSGELGLLAGTTSDTTNDRMQDPQTKVNMGGGGKPKK